MNPAVDVSSSVEVMDAYQKLRCHDVLHHPGGGGINVSRVIKRLNGETLAIFPCGGPMGMMLDGLLADEDIPRLAIPIAGDTREDFSVSEEATGKQFRFILPGPHLSSLEVDACHETIVAQLRPGSFLIASGSLPPGAPTGFYTRLSAVAEKASAKFVVDSSGASLRAVVNHGGCFLIKPSQSELADLTGEKLNDRAACIEAADRLVTAGKAKFVCVSMGAEGAVLVGENEAHFAQTPEIPLKTTIGAGDSLLAAMVLAFSNGASPAEALQLGVAAGAASLLVSGTALCAASDVPRLKAQVRIDRVNLTR